MAEWDWKDWLALGGSVAQGAGALWGAANQDKANDRNFEAQRQQQQLIQAYIGNYLQSPQSPYADAVMRFIGGNPTSSGAPPGTPVAQFGGNMANAQNGIRREGIWLDPKYDAYFPDQPRSETLTGPMPQQQNLGFNETMQRYTPQEAFTFDPQMLGAAPQAQQQFSAAAGGFNVPTVTGTQGVNAGQDALLQMMRRSFEPPRDAQLGNQLAQLGAGNSQYDNTDLFAALNNQADMALSDQVAQLQGSAGSLGQRFGTAMNLNESRLRQRSLVDRNTLNQQIGAQSFESAQNRALQALGLSAGREQALGQLGLQGAGLNLQAAQSAQQGAFEGQGLDLQAQLANAQNALTAGLQTQQLGQQNNQFNAQLGTQNNQFNVQNMLQQMLANQNAANQGGQFNAQMQQTMSGQNAQQMNIFNNLMLQALGQASGMQQQQMGSNTSLIGLLAGLGIPQSSPSAFPGALSNIGQIAMMYPIFRQLGQES